MAGNRRIICVVDSYVPKALRPSPSAASPVTMRHQGIRCLGDEWSRRHEQDSAGQCYEVWELTMS